MCEWAQCACAETERWRLDVAHDLLQSSCAVFAHERRATVKQVEKPILVQAKYAYTRLALGARAPCVAVQ